MTSECRAVETCHGMVNVQYCRIKWQCGFPLVVVYRLTKLTSYPRASANYMLLVLSTYTNHVTLCVR